MKKWIKICVGTLLICSLMLGLGYLGLSVYYENGFSFRTYINGIYCTGKSVEVVNQELNESFVYDGLNVVTKYGSFKIEAEDISYTYDYREPLSLYLERQNPYLWVNNLFGTRDDYTLQPAVSYDKVALQDIIKNELKKLNMPKTHEVILQSTEEGFVLTDTKLGVLNLIKLSQVVDTALLEGQVVVDASGSDYYYNKTYTAVEEQLMSFYSQIDEYQSRKVTYHFGEDEETLERGDLAKTLACYSFFLSEKRALPSDFETRFYDENMHLKVEETVAESLLEERFASYNTYRNHTFKAHDGRMLNIKGGTYGNLLDMKAEKKEFTAFLVSDMKEYDREPEYIKQIGLKGKDDIGDTYIEVDIGRQKMFYYENGSLRLKTDVVTGKNKATREEVCYVYMKQKNRILRGPGYASPVDYWMPVSGNIGIHDASWRDEYGGDIYLTNGSHGCINTPLDKVSELYEIVEIGTPCIIYYGIDN